jgi:hypothetical protein
MARRISRPMALRVTWVVAPWGVSANAATILAWICGVQAAIAFGWGTPVAWLIGAVMLQLWYLFDHVDGQLARLHGTSSLDGVQLDFLMHHTINVLVPLGVGHGVFLASGGLVWLWLGAAWGIASLLITLHHDARYKSFIVRLKRLRGTLRVHGGGAERPGEQPGIPRHPIRLAVWTARKLCEMHVVMNLLCLIAAAAWLADDGQLCPGQIYLVVMASAATGVAVLTLVRSQRNETAEREFAAWYQPAPGEQIVYDAGWWRVESTSSEKDPGEVAGG